MFLRLKRVFTIILGVLGICFIIIAIIFAIAMTKNKDIHIDYDNGFDASYAVDINVITGNVVITSNHLDIQRNGIVTRTKMGTLNFIDNIVVFSKYYFFKTDVGILCEFLENNIS